jgi:hypothetical protein
MLSESAYDRARYSTRSERTEAESKTSKIQQYLIITSAFSTMRLPAETAVHIVAKSNHVRAWQSPF